MRITCLIRVRTWRCSLRNELSLSIQRQADFETRFAGLGF
jgi:hypothetical protein